MDTNPLIVRLAEKPLVVVGTIVFVLAIGFYGAWRDSTGTATDTLKQLRIENENMRRQIASLEAEKTKLPVPRQACTDHPSADEWADAVKILNNINENTRKKKKCMPLANALFTIVAVLWIFPVPRVTTMRASASACRICRI